MKKVLAFLLVAVLVLSVFSFVGCNNDPTDPSITKPNSTSPTNTTTPTNTTKPTTTKKDEANLDPPEDYPEASEGLAFKLTADGKGYEVSKGSFYGKEVVIPYYYNGLPVVAIAAQGFAYRELRSITMPDTITEIGKWGLADISAEEIKLSSNLKKIGECAFQGSTIKTIHIPASVEEIGDTVFLNCELLETITVDSDSMYYKTLDGVLYTKDERVLVWCPPKGITSHTVSEATEIIAPYAFYMNQSLKNIVLPSNLRLIGERAFSTCLLLESVNIPASVYDIGLYAFSNCEGMKTITFEKNSILENIQDGAFEACFLLKEIKIPASVITIYPCAFSACTSLERVEFEQGSRLERIYSEGFAYCESLKEIELPSNLEMISGMAFIGCGLSKVSIPVSIKIIGDQAFSNCLYLTEMYYAGTADDWAKIDIDSEWIVSYKELEFFLICTDQTVKVNSYE